VVSILTPPTLEVREGTTSRIEMELDADDEPIDLTSVDHIELEIRDSRRNVYRYSSADASPKVGVNEEPSTGKVWLDPPASLFKTIASPYLGYFWVFTSATSKFSVPEDLEFVIQVRRNY
jgi:hypothetical protein